MTKGLHKNSLRKGEPNKWIVEDIIERIRAEVNRQAKSIDTATGDFAEGRKMEQRIILSILSDLEKEEKPTNQDDIDTEIGHWMDHLDDKYCMLVNHYSIQDIKDTARHFYALGQQSKPKVCEGLKEEIQRFLSNATKMDKGEWKGKYPISEMGFGVVARHFAQWGAEHLKK